MSPLRSPKNPKTKGSKRQKTEGDDVAAEDKGEVTTKSTENAECAYNTLRQSKGGEEETKEVKKPARKKPVRNKTKIVP